MGIKGLNKFLEKKCKNGIFKENLSKLKKKTIGIDTSIFLYKYTYMGNMILHFLKQIEHLLSYEITPVYLFDGKPTDDKSKVIEKRKETFKNNQEKIEELKKEIEKIEEENNFSDDTTSLLLNNLNDEIKKKTKNNIRISYEEVDKFKQILKNLNIYYYECDGETDCYVKSFFNKKLIDYVITEDLDFLTHGSKNVITKYTYSSNYVKINNLTLILKDLDIDYNSFVNLCLILGCDYYPKGVKNLGPVKGYNLIKKYSSIENILENENISIYEDFDYKHILSLFLTEKSIEIQKSSLYIHIKNVNKLYFENFDFDISNILLYIKKISETPNIMMFLNIK